MSGNGETQSEDGYYKKTTTTFVYPDGQSVTRDIWTLREQPVMNCPVNGVTDLPSISQMTKLSQQKPKDSKNDEQKNN